MSRTPAGAIRAPREAAGADGGRPGVAPPSRVVIEDVTPQVEGGRFAANAIAGGTVRVEADVFADGHDRLAATLRYRRESDPEWSEAPMAYFENDRFAGHFPVPDVGPYRYTVAAWVDRFESWRHAVKAKREAGARPASLAADLEAGAGLVDAAAAGEDAPELRALAARLREGGTRAVRAALSRDLRRLMAAHPDRRDAETFERELPVFAERERAGFGAWYELFPRSTSPEPGRHGTFADTAARLPYVSSLGFDVVYLPPIHPIGATRRRGPNNAVRSGRGDVGSPWAIGGAAGGHTAVHPDLGTLEDFDALVARAAELNLEVALDLALQCSPDHPWVTEHPEWFRHRPDGTIHHAENPPKKYEDIYPLDFESEAWRELWGAVLDVVRFWIAHGVTIFRVDNPHTKPFAFWEWLIARVREEHPETIFLSEAFTRPKVMYRLAKLGFSQSYTYFTWRHDKEELTEYLTELRDRLAFVRPNLWPNTPDILNEYLRDGGRPAFAIRLVLAATVAANYGIYGPAFELSDARSLSPDREEYLDSEKYQLRHWDLERADSLAPLITRINRIRRDNPALRNDHSLVFHPVENDDLIAYTKATDDRSNIVLVVVNLNPRRAQSGWLNLQLADLGLDGEAPFQVHDLVQDVRYRWKGGWNFVELDPAVFPAHVFRLRRRVRSERDFEHYQ